MSERWFTPASARGALRRIRPAAERAARIVRELEARRPPDPADDQRVDPYYFLLLLELNVRLERIASEGAVLRDPVQGCIDFPAFRAGRAVWLCWRVGEPSIAFWHDAGPAVGGRRPLDVDGPWEVEQRGG